MSEHPSSGRPRRRHFVAALGALATAAIVAVGPSPRAARSAFARPGDPVIGVSAEVTPVRLPRSQTAPASLRIAFTSGIPGAPATPELTGITFALSRDLQIRTAGLPSCPIGLLYAQSADAAATCAASLVGHGTVVSEITLPGQVAVTVQGRLLAFYDDGEGQPRILAQIVGGSAMPLTYVVPFTIYRDGGAFPTALSAQRMQFIAGECPIGHPNCFSQTYTYTGIYGHISRFELTLGRTFVHAHRTVSFMNAECPAAGRAHGTALHEVGVRLAYPGLFPREQIATGRCEVSAQRRTRARS